MRRKLATIYAIFCLALLLAGLSLVFYFAWNAGTNELVKALVSIVLSLILAPTLHELGHIFFAFSCDMELNYAKFFCFQVQRISGRLRFCLASPFAPDETQVVPKRGGDMKKRATFYTLGGLIVQGAFTFLFTCVAVVLACCGIQSFLFWGFLPYAWYLFLLNVAPFAYPSGKTDMLVYLGLKKGESVEKNMLNAMEIQGRLYAGESFAEIEETLYFSAPQLCEDEPLYAMMLDLQYRYYLEKNELEKAAERLNRLASAQAYLTEKEVEKIAAELTYMHALNGDYERAEESGKLCQNYLKENNPTAKRILAAYSAAFGKTDAARVLIAQAQELMGNERMLGARRFEEKLLSRISLV